MGGKVYAWLIPRLFDFQARAMGLPDTRGALVNSVQPGSPAQKAGIERMDVIRSVDGQPINDSSDLPPIIGAMAPGSKVRVELLRDGKPRTVTATLDALAPGLILGFMVISLADFLGGPGYGTLTAVPWGLSQYGVRRHPVQLYELLAGVLALFVWWRMVDGRRYAGQLFLITITIYSATRLFLDVFRDNTWITAAGYHGWQIVAFAAMLLGHWYLVDHGMPLAPLRRLTLAYGIAVAARIGVLAVAAARTPGLGERFGSAEAFLRGGGATLLLVAAFGVLLPPLLAAGAWGTLRVPNTQSATGILYVAVIAAFTGELAATGAGW